MTSSNRAMRFARTSVLYVALAAIALLFATPLLWMLSASLKPEGEVLAVPPSLLPSSPQWGNYVEAFRAILPFFTNSVIVTSITVTFVIIASALAGYGFARLRFRGQKVAFVVMLATAAVPGIVLLLPQYIMYRQFGWVDTWWPLTIPKILTPIFGTFLMRQAFLSVPRELGEAAMLDGASRFRTFAQIMVPQVKPTIAAVAILAFLESWNDLFGPLLFINSASLQTLPISLALFRGEYFTQTNVLMAAATLSIVPPLLVFMFAQRYFVRGIATSGLK